ncbi:GNAT family N-acetyltransferase [Flavobacterium enshiense]|uniref:GNAT family N-acetyltransferase n=1 Tax=Flavobacterium enshiense TaxID=1341165 RepID=UPI00345D2177
MTNLILETERLLMRPLELTDAEDMFTMDSNPNVHKYLWQKPYQSIEESIANIEYVRKQYETNNIGRFATILKETGEFIGWTGIKFVTEEPENGNINFYDYGYRLNEKFWGKGYASEATLAWFDYGFNKMKIEIMNAYAHSENGASNHILQKSGMRFVESYLDKEGILWNWWQMENNQL